MPPPGDTRYVSVSPSPSIESECDCEDAGNVESRAPSIRMDLDSLPSGHRTAPAPGGIWFPQFCEALHTQLPGDSSGRGQFDTRTTYVVGDPGAKSGTAAPLEYATTGEVGLPHWDTIFEYILRKCGYLVKFDTVYVMTDNRNLADHTRPDTTLPHWPAAARWWHSRLQLLGPHKEKTELLFFPFQR